MASGRFRLWTTPYFVSDFVVVDTKLSSLGSYLLGRTFSMLGDVHLGTMRSMQRDQLLCISHMAAYQDNCDSVAASTS